MRGLSAITLMIILPFLSACAGVVDSTERYFYTALGWPYSNHQDKGMSPLVFSGSGGHAGMGVFVLRPSGMHQFDLRFTGAALSAQDFDPTVRLFRGDLEYSYQRLVLSKPERKLGLLVGGAWQNMTALRHHTRYTNNSINYEFMSSLSIAATVIKRFELFNRHWSFHWQASLPVFSLQLRPQYASSAPEAYPEHEEPFKIFYKSLRPASFGSTFRLNSQFRLLYELRRNNKVGLTYYWDFYRINHIPVNRVTAGYHALIVSLMFDF